MGRKHNEFGIYEFRIEGRLDTCWSDWFDGLEIQYTEDEEANLPVTILIGPVMDQSALHGILEKISGLNLKLLSVNQVRGNIS